MAFDTTTVIGESIRDVLITLLEAIVLVIIVIYVFLQDWRSTFIPAITIPVSLIGTFVFVKLLGFSINTLTLFGITLATGLVVDDAIVVIENVERHIVEGITEPHNAASVAMKEVAGAVIATSLVLVAVFVPVALFPGNHRNPLSAIRSDDRVLRFDLRVQRADADSGTLSDFSREAPGTRAGRFFKTFNEIVEAGTNSIPNIPCGTFSAGDLPPCWSFSRCSVAPTWCIRAFRARSSRTTIRATSCSSCRRRRAPR